MTLTFRTAAFLAAVAAQGAPVEATWGLDVLRPILANARNHVVALPDCTLEGFTPDRQTEHRVPSLRRIGFPARITVRAPAGTYFTGIVVYDTAGEERISISIDGAEQGVAAANFDDNRERLFFVAEPRAFRGGETIEFKALGGQGRYRVENIVMLAEKPAPRRRINAVRDLFVDARGNTATITWITAWPVSSTLEWGPDGGAIRESAPMRNHRVILTGLRERQSYRFRIVSPDEAAADWRTFETATPAPVRGTVERSRVPLHLAAYSRPFPATSGVPFPKGALAADRNVRLLDAGGAETALQTRTLATWDDGSVKWALLDFQANGQDYTLEFGRGVHRAQPAHALRVDEGAEQVEVSAGPLRFTVNKRRFGLIESAWFGGQRLISPEKPSAFYITAPDDALYSSLGRPDEVVVEENGPLRAVIRASGTHRAADGSAWFAYVVRIHAYAGQSYLRVQYTLGNNVNATQFASVKSAILRVPLETAAAAVKPARIRAATDQDRVPGWAEWGGRVTLGLRDFWQNYPKDLAVSGDGLELGICPLLDPGEYANAKGEIDEHRLYYYLRDGLYTFHQGMTKTHDIWLDLGGAPSPVRTENTPLFAAAPAFWYAESGAVGELAPVKESGIIAQYDGAFARGFEQYRENRERNHEYGMLNFGDWWGERVINWGNTEYDTAHAFFLQFLRTGNPDYLRTAEEAEWHNRDVDSIHYSPVATRIGGVYYHSVGHTGRWYPSSPVAGRGINVGDTVVDHTFIEGRLDNWFLRGDRRSFEAARNTANRYCGTYTRNYDFEVVRQPGWHLIMSMAMYGATGDRFYLNSAKIIIDRVLERQRDDGAWELLDFLPCAGAPPNSGQQTFMVGVLLTGLKQYHEVTRDPRVAEAIVKGVRFTIERAWSDEAHGLRNTPCLNIRPGYGSAFLAFEGFAYAHRLTNDPRIREVLLSGIGPSIGHMSGMGKSFTQYTRSTPHFIGYVDGLK